ncbi:MAG: hypothetical protein K6C30_09230, partial [Bacteroidaceae bacterium]|nr:hypothetical protein [Bacteroidaceae bacterium]
AALEAFLERCAEGEVIQPRETTADSTFVYVLSTPRRGNRYLTSQGNNKNLTGLDAPTDLSRWTFKRHRDGAWYILNATDMTFISTSASNNTALSSSRARSSKGWSIKASAEAGLVIIVSGSLQINQCNAGLNYQIYNWGGGNNTTDDGCKYLIQPVEAFATAVESLREEGPSATNNTCYDLGGRPAGRPSRNGIYVVDGRKVVY